MNYKQITGDMQKLGLPVWINNALNKIPAHRLGPIMETITRESLMTIALLFGVSIVAFSILFMAPGDPFAVLLGNQGSVAASGELKESLGISSSWIGQYTTWLGNMLQGDFGTSIRSGEPVLPTVIEVTINTLNLTLAAIFVTLLISYPIGLISALRKDPMVTTPISIFAYVISSLPIFWIGYMAVFISVNYFDYFPLASSFGDGDEFQWIKFLFPVLVLGLGSGLISEVVRHVRFEISRVMEEEYIRTARAKGAKVWKHAMKEAFILPITEIVSSKIPFFLGGAIIVEQIFNWHGMGRMAWQAAQDRDFPVILCITLVAALLVRGGSLLQKVIYIIVNPRASHE
ncbi:MAG: ABC transporter permease [Gammaproteobacteria bacterium]|nr:ABC transporter permease [Gammaproteobacteria bacterium]